MLKAIKWAVEKNVDIISMSLGLSRPIEGRDDEREWEEARDSIDMAIAAASSQIFFIAAGNGGKNEKTLFPANSNKNHVFAIYASDGKGTRTTVNPTSGRKQAFMTLGKSVPLLSLPRHGGEHIYCNGTSYATPIAAGIAALFRTIDFHKLPKRLSKKTLSELDQWGPDAVTMLFELMGPTEDYQYVCPWNLITMDSRPLKRDSDLTRINDKFDP